MSTLYLEQYWIWCRVKILPHFKATWNCSKASRDENVKWHQKGKRLTPSFKLQSIFINFPFSENSFSIQKKKKETTVSQTSLTISVGVEMHAKKRKFVALETLKESTTYPLRPSWKKRPPFINLLRFSRLILDWGEEMLQNITEIPNRPSVWPSLKRPFLTLGHDWRIKEFL